MASKSSVLLSDQFRKIWRKRTQPDGPDKIIDFLISEKWQDDEILSQLMEIESDEADLSRMARYTGIIDQLRALERLGENTAENPFKGVSALLNLTGELEIVGFRIYVSDPPTFALDLKNEQRVELGEASHLRSQSSVANKLVEQCRRSFKPIPSGKWRDLVQTLLDHAVDDDSLGKAATDRGLILSWLDAYFVYHALIDTAKLKDDKEITYEEIYKEGDYAFVNSISFTKFLRIHNIVKDVSATRLGKLFRILGAEAEQTPNIFVNQKRTRLRLWKISIKILEEEGILRN